MAIYGYHRVSTKKQELENGIHQLKELGIPEENIFYEKQSGKSTKNRTKLNELLKVVEPGDEVVVLKIDRLARSLVDLNLIVEELQGKQVSIKFVQENLLFGTDKNDFINKLLLSIMGSFAEFERSVIVNRMEEGKQYKRETDPDFREGRKKKYKKAQLDHAIALLETHSYSEVEDVTGISKSTLIREKNRRKAAVLS